MLYFVLWLPGLISNVVYWRAAIRDEQLIGQSPPGKGCLVAMLWWFIVLPIVGLVVLGIVVAASHH